MLEGQVKQVQIQRSEVKKEVKRLQESKRALLERVGALDKEKARLRNDVATLDEDMSKAKVKVQESERERLEAEEETHYLVEQQQEFVDRHRETTAEIKRFHDQNTKQFSILMRVRNMLAGQADEDLGVKGRGKGKDKGTTGAGAGAGAEESANGGENESLPRDIDLEDLEKFADAPPRVMIELVQILNKLDAEGARRNEVQYQRDNLLKTRKKLESNIDLVKKTKGRLPPSEAGDEVWSPILVDPGLGSTRAKLRHKRRPVGEGGNNKAGATAASASTAAAATGRDIRTKNPFAKANSSGSTASLRLTADALAMHEDSTMPPKPVLTPSQSVMSASSELSRSGAALFKESLAAQASDQVNNDDSHSRSRAEQHRHPRGARSNRTVEDREQDGARFAWTKGKLLGKGGFASVYIAFMATGEFYAVKEIKLGLEDEDEDEWLSANGATSNLGHVGVAEEMEDSSWESVEEVTATVAKGKAAGDVGSGVIARSRAGAGAAAAGKRLSQNTTQEIEYYKAIGVGGTVSTATGASVSNRARVVGGSKRDSARKMDALKLQSEVELMKDLEHANIVRYYGAEVTGLTLNIFMEVGVGVGGG